REGEGGGGGGARAGGGAADQGRGRWLVLVHPGGGGPVRRRPYPARGAVVSLRAQVPGWLVCAGDRRGVPPVAGRGRRPPPAGLGGQAHPACAAAFLRLPALPRGDEPVRHPGTARSRLDRHHGPVHPRPQHARRGRLGRRAAARRRPVEGTSEMRWNLRLAAANRGIWKASELQRLLADRGLVISVGKMSGLWSGQPNTVKLDALDVSCAALGCGIAELLLPDPVAAPEPEPAAGESTGTVAEARTRHAPVPDRPVPAAPVTGDRHVDGGPAGRGFPSGAG